VKLPWTKDKEAELRLWAIRSFPEASPDCAARAALVIAQSVDTLEELPLDRPLAETAQLSELDRVQLFLALEQEFGFSIADEDANSLNTPAEIVSYVERMTVENKKGEKHES
jgi:acyl carrier protein